MFLLFLQDGKPRSHHHPVNPPASILHLSPVRQPHTAGQRQTGPRNTMFHLVFIFCCSAPFLLILFAFSFFCHFFVAFFPYWRVFLLVLMFIFLIRCSFVPPVVVLSSTFCFVFVSLFWLFLELFCCPFSSLFLLSVFFVQSGFLTSFSRL